MQQFETLLYESAKAHGHMCPGQVIGVRMALLGCRLIGLDAPKNSGQIKKLLIYVEMDRCAADAIAHVTGAQLGRRSLKFMDYGIMAASFINLETGTAVRVISTEDSRYLYDNYAPEVEDKKQRQIAGYKRMPDCLLFRVQRVRVKYTDNDLPGPTRQKMMCSHCAQVIRDGRHVTINGEIRCKPCAGNSYFDHAVDISWPDMGWSPENQETHKAEKDLPCKK